MKCLLLAAAVLSVFAPRARASIESERFDFEYGQQIREGASRLNRTKTLDAARGELRKAFEAGRKPSLDDLGPRKTWRCYSVTNQGDKSHHEIDEVVFDSFGGTILSTQDRPQPTLEYAENAGGIYATYGAGKKRWSSGRPPFTAVAMYRAAADGSLRREVSLLWAEAGPLDFPAGVPQLAPAGLGEPDLKTLKAGNKMTVYSYARCEPLKP